MPLVLTRRPGETIRIGDDITITVAAISGNQCRLVITAPRDVVIDREEIYQAKEAERDAEYHPQFEHMAKRGSDVGPGIGGYHDGGKADAERRRQEALDIAERRQLDEAGRGHLKRP